MGIPQIIQLFGKIVVTLAIGWLLVVLVDTVLGTDAAPPASEVEPGLYPAPGHNSASACQPLG
jgi:energy-converting hydrogenase Eha subunit B